ncbi:MAG: WD40 repeat domain-containing protein, partial [Anaerolineales bacterium]|nr:WD40 repeat domain-containing protein [Anaerolineales bacterium]
MMKRITLFGFCLLGLMLCSCTPAGTADTTLTPNPATATPIPPSKTPTQALTPTITLTITQTAKVTSTPYPTVEPHEFAITVQNVQEVVQLKELGKNRPHYVAWSPNGAYIATANYSEVTIYATDSLVALQTIDPDQRIESIAFGPDPNKLFIIDQYVHEWDLRTGQEIDIHGYLESGIRNFAVSENGKVITYSGPAWGGGGDPDYVFAIQRVGQVLTGYEQDTKKRNKSIDLLRSDSR